MRAVRWWQVDALYADCRAAVEASLPVPSAAADRTCNKIEDYITRRNVSGGVNVYDVRLADGAPQPG